MNPFLICFLVFPLALHAEEIVLESRQLHLGKPGMYEW